MSRPTCSGGWFRQRLVERDGVVVVAGQVVGVAELEQRCVARIELDGPLEAPQGEVALAFRHHAACQLIMVFGVVARLVGELGQHRARLGQLPFNRWMPPSATTPGWRCSLLSPPCRTP